MVALATKMVMLCNWPWIKLGFKIKSVQLFPLSHAAFLHAGPLLISLFSPLPTAAQNPHPKRHGPSRSLLHHPRALITPHVISCIQLTHHVLTRLRVGPFLPMVPACPVRPGHGRYHSKHLLST